METAVYVCILAIAVVGTAHTREDRTAYTLTAIALILFVAILRRLTL